MLSLFGKQAWKTQLFSTLPYARWRQKRTSEAIDKQYQAWPLRNRIMITLTCH